MVKVGIAVFVLMKNRNEGRNVAWVSGFSECDGGVHSCVEILVCKEGDQSGTKRFGVRLSECLCGLSSNSPIFIETKIIQEGLRLLVLLKPSKLPESPESMKARKEAVWRGCRFCQKIAMPNIFC